VVVVVVDVVVSRRVVGVSVLITESVPTVTAAPIAFGSPQPAMSVQAAVSIPPNPATHRTLGRTT
jgi:hypothetical protein